MKKLSLYIAILIFTLSYAKTFSQENFKFLPDDARMIECRYRLPSSHWSLHYRYYEYYVIGDTLIGDEFYQKLGTKNKGYIYVNHIADGQNETTFAANDRDFGLFAAIRKDSSQVFFRLLNKVNDQLSSKNPHGHWNHETINSFPLNEDILIYDFNVETINSQSWSHHFNKTPAIDTITTDNGLEKLRYMFYDGINMTDPHGADFWIQDIGSSRGLLGNFDVDWSSRDVPFLNYFCSSSLTYHYFASCNLCNNINCRGLVTSIRKKINEETIDASLVNLFPNPNQGEFTIKNELDKSISRLSIFNSIGQLIENIDTAFLAEVAQISPDAYNVVLKDESPGIYFLLISFNDGTSLYKELIII